MRPRERLGLCGLFDALSADGEGAALIRFVCRGWSSSGFSRGRNGAAAMKRHRFRVVRSRRAARVTTVLMACAVTTVCLGLGGLAFAADRTVLCEEFTATW